MKPFAKGAAAVVAIVLLGTLGFRYSGTLAVAAGKATAFSAALLLADGLIPAVTETTSSAPQAVTSSQPPAQSSAPASLTPSPPEGVETGEIQTTTLSLTAANTTAKGVHISNKTGLNVDVDAYLQQGLPFSLKDTSQPQVLIVHTHATEAYTEGDYGYYVKSASTRSTDTAKNTVAVGAAIAGVLNDAGIVTINDDTLHDSPNYTGSYTRSAETIREYLEKYPSIQVVIDGHRDAIAKDDNTKVKPTATVNGQKAAQIMILAGCETGSVEDFPDWEENFRFCLQLQKQIETDYPGLARPLLFKACKYNFDLLGGSILIEIGTDANTLEEAVYSGKLLGQALVQVLGK